MNHIYGENVHTFAGRVSTKVSFFSQTHIYKILAEAFIEVAEEGCLCGFIQEDKVLDPHPVPGS